MKVDTLIALSILLGSQISWAGAAPMKEAPVVNPYAEWEGFVPAVAPWFFPIAVYTQPPERADKYKAIGINTYYHLWKGPTSEQIAELKKHGMRTICEFNTYAQEALLDDPTVLAWTHRDEPDLVSTFKRKYLLKDQARAKALVKEHWPKMYDAMDLDNTDYNGWGFGYGPASCREYYEHIKQFDTKRPVIMGLSKGVVVPFNGRGDRKQNNEDYIEYLTGTCDMNGKLVTSNGLLRDPDMTAAIKKQNSEIKSLAKVIYAPEIETVSLATEPKAKLDFVAKKVDDSVYILSSTMTTHATEATFIIKGLGDAQVEVINEDRTLPVKDGVFTDSFGGYDVNLYKIK